jgi:hypothetical protein
MASGGGQTWIAAPEKTHADSGWFGYGGYRPTKVPTTLKINRTIIETNNLRRDTYDVNVYQRRNDLHSETRGITPTPNPRPPVVQPELKSNDVYVNEQGDVYRRTDAGWQEREGNDWKPQQPTRDEPSRTDNSPPENNRNNAGAPDRDYQARERGESRAGASSPPPQSRQPSGPRGK